MLPCCRPQQLRCFGLRDSFLPLPRVPLLTQLHHVATGPSPRYHGALKFGSLRSQYHIKLPDKLQFIGLPHLQTVNAWASLETWTLNRSLNVRMTIYEVRSSGVRRLRRSVAKPRMSCRCHYDCMPDYYFVF